MPTVSKVLADQLRAGNGYYMDDLRVMRIIEYTNASGGTSYGLEYAHQIGKYSASEYVINPRIYWSADPD